MTPGQRVDLGSGKYVEPLQVSDDGQTATVLSTNVVTDGVGNPTQVSLTPGLTLAAIRSLLGYS